MDYSFSAPDNTQGEDPDFLGKFLNYKTQSDSHHLQMMKDMAEFQSNLRLNELAKTMALQSNQERINRANEAPIPGGSVGTPGFSAFGGSVGRGVTDPYRQLELSQNQEKINNARLSEQDKNKIAQENADTKKSGTETPEQKTARQLQGITARGTNALDLEDRRQTGRTDLEDTRETNRESLEGVRQTGRQANIKLRGSQATEQIRTKGEEARKTKQTQSPGAATNLPSQDLIRRMTTAQQLINENPGWDKFIKIDPNTKNVSVVQPSAPGIFGTSSGPDQATYTKILDKLYPERATMSGGQPQTQNNNNTTNPDPTHVMVQDGQGRKFFWDTTRGAIPQGYTAVGGGGQDQEEE